MERLVVNPGSPTAWDIELKPGANSIGRGFANDFKITDPSVSTSHCQIVIDSGHVIIKDLGSTNGTFVDRARVTETRLHAGQTVHLGAVEMLFRSDAPPPPPPAIARIVTRPAPVALSDPVQAPPLVAAVPAQSATASPYCKFHPRSLGRYSCLQCQVNFCDLCVTTRPSAGGAVKYCRRCGSECVPLKVQIQAPGASQNFYRRLPGVFAYPFKGAGVFVLIVCTIVISALDFVSAGWLAIFAKAAFFGYLFAFMQNIIHSTASADEEIPGWPAFDGLLGGFFRLAGAALVSFGAALALFVIPLFHEEPSDTSIFFIPSLIFGCLYFPMALLAVAMKDTPFAANPLLVIPTIFKVPLEYLLTVILLGVVMAIYASGGPLIHAIFPRELRTHSMPKLFAYLGSKALWSFINVYLLAVTVRILGLLYLTKKQKFGWFAR
jgi:pSer/pThr/pTyr-binding forkhead associated (FHA) protein